MDALKRSIRLLYTGRSRRAAHFRYALIGFDILVIAFFVLSTPLDPSWPLLTVDYLIGALLTADLAARYWIAPKKTAMLFEIYTIADILIVLSLLLAPFFPQNVAFLRVVHTLRLLYTFHVLRDLRRDSAFFRRYEEVITSSVNMIIFIFFMTAIVYVVQVGQNPSIKSYVDALYFTVATLTTTGFGDITLTGSTGRLLAVFIMVVGVALFLRLVRAIFQPQKVNVACPDCGLKRHDHDAIHCKHCGKTLHIETDGLD
jgi:voltage-gated potassium channel